MNSARQMGIAIGIVVGIIIVMIVLKAINKDGKMRTEYDEMQEKARGKAYMYAFWAIAIYECIMMLLTSGTSLPVDGFVVHFGAVIVGVLVQASYSIWHDAYIGLNTNPAKFAVFAVIISLFNFGISIPAIVKGNMVENGVLQMPAANLLCGILFIVIGIEIFIKMVADKSRTEE